MAVRRLIVAVAIVVTGACASGTPPAPGPAPFQHLAVSQTFRTFHVAPGPGLVTSIVPDDSGRILAADHAHLFLLERSGDTYTFRTLAPPAVPAWLPTGLAYRDGLVYVANDAGHDVLALRLTGGTLSLVRRFTAPAMQTPQNVAVDQDGSIVVADQGGRALLKFNASGTLQWRTALDGVAAVAAGGGSYFATSSTLQQVVKVSSGGDIVKVAGSRGASRGKYDLPVGLAAVPGGRLVVTDAYNGRVTVLDQDLRVVDQTGANGGGLDALNLPFATAATSDGYVIADTYKSRLVRTDRRWTETEQIVFGRMVPAGRERPLVYGTDERPRAYPMLPGLDVAADLKLRDAVPFVGGFDGVEQAGSVQTPIHLTFADSRLGRMGQTWAQKVGSYDVVGSPTNGRLEVIDPSTGMFVYVDVGGDAWWRADGVILLPGGLRRSLTDVVAPARAAFDRAAQLIGQGVARRDAFDRALGDGQPRNWAADLLSPAGRQFLASPMTADDARRYYDTALKDPQQRVVELLEVKYLSGT